MNAELRALAERLGALQECECPNMPDNALGYLCSICDDTYRRLPTEAEVRAAIRAAGWPELRLRIEVGVALATIGRTTATRDVAAWAGEAEDDEIVLLALLRALEVVRRG